MFRLLALCIAFACLLAPASADGVLQKLTTPADQKRLDAFDETRKQAIAEAEARGDAADIAILKDALAGTPLSMSGDFDATGDWRCRVIKLGGLLPLTVYPPFKCKITDDGAGWFLKKFTGSQRTEGRFYTESDTRLVYLGTGFVAGETPHRYGEGPDWDQVAVAERLEPRRLLLQFPLPRYESKFDLLLLER